MTPDTSRVPLLRLVPAEPARDWRDDAACLGLDTELFFPLIDRAEFTDTPRRVCRGCPVRAECLADVMATEDPAHRFGVVGGTIPRERRALHRADRAAGTAAGAAAAPVGGDAA